MSVLVMNPKCFEYIRCGLILAAYRTTVDAFHSGAIYAHFKNRDVETEATRLIKSWAALNDLSFCVAYNQKGDSLCEFNGPRTYQIIPVQLLKYVECLLYNIELETIASKKSYSSGTVQNVPNVTNLMREDHALLKAWCGDIKDRIIGNLLEYELAHWSEEPGTAVKIPVYIQNQIEENHTIHLLAPMNPL